MVWYVPVCMCLCEFLKSKIQWNQQQVVSILIPTYTNLQRTIQKICLIISGSGHIMLIHEYLEMDVYGLPLVINSVCVVVSLGAGVGSLVDRVEVVNIDPLDT